MCGIFSIYCPKSALETLIESLKKLEYRGYDSSGVATFSLKGRASQEGVLGQGEGKQDDFALIRRVGKISMLEEALSDPREEEQELIARLQGAKVLISHTRWATHGEPSEANAHPHRSPQGRICLVHNGIIENYQQLKERIDQERAKEGREPLNYASGTDTEVLAAWIDHRLSQKREEGDIARLFSLQEELQGAFAFVLLDLERPGEMVACSRGSPLILGKDASIDSSSPSSARRWLISSDLQALTQQVQLAMHLPEGVLALIGEKLTLYEDPHHLVQAPPFTPITQKAIRSQLGSYEHYMRKEIDEQPDVIRALLQRRLDREQATALFPEIALDRRVLHRFERLQILACGSSFHAGLIAASLLEEWARLPVDVEISSEFRYKNPLVAPETLVIAISQSGETADTLAATSELKAKGVYVVALCNVEGSSLERVADATLPLGCGPEISVASTKAFTAQILQLSLFALQMARLRDMDRAQASAILQALTKIPAQIESILSQEKEIERLAQKYSHYKDFFFIGRRYMYPIALEGALKLKELSYINANGYPAGELKHGPISLIHPNCPTVALFASEQVFDKTCSNVMEIKARGGKVLALSYEGAPPLEEIVDDLFVHPKTLDPLAPLLSTIFLQLFSYHVAKKLYLEIDRPRNLAKSVTVE